MSTTALPVAARTSAALAGGAVAGGLVVAALLQVGSAVALAPLAVGALAAVVSRPALAAAALLVPVIVLESDPQGFLPATSSFYRPLPLVPLLPTDLLIGLLALSVIVARSRGRPLRWPEPFGAATMVMSGALITGITTGYFAGGDSSEMLGTARTVGYLAIVPFLLVNAIELGRTRMVLGAAAAAAGLKAVAGIVAVAVGAGRSLGNGRTLAYYGPSANWLFVLVILGVMAAVVVRLRLPPLAWVVGALSIGGLAVSFRRSFWIAALLGAALVLLLGTGRRGRRLLMSSGAVSVVALWVALTAGGLAESPVVERARTITPTALQATADDRYRFAEQRNVLAEIARRPVTGLGAGVAWEVSSPLPVMHPGGLYYTHVALLSWWLKLGLLGGVSYVLLMVTVGRAAWDVGRRQLDPLLRVGGLGVFGGIIGLVVAETTGTFTIVDLRLCILFASVMAWLSLVRPGGFEGGSATPAPSS